MFFLSPKWIIFSSKPDLFCFKNTHEDNLCDKDECYVCMNLSNIKDEKSKKKIQALKNVQSIIKEELKKLLEREKCYLIL